MDVNVADLDKLRQPPTTLHNLELDLKQIDEKWHEIGDNAKPDDLVDELKELERNESRPSPTTTTVDRKPNGGQPEQDDRTNYYNETPQPEVGQPTEQQIQREQQQIDDEIQGEINKDIIETMKVGRVVMGAEGGCLAKGSPNA